jgi:hypothetical protein
MWWFCYIITFHNFWIFWRMGFVPQGFVGLIKTGSFMVWLLIQKEGQEDSYNISCLFQVSFVAVSYLDNKPISILSTTFSPIDHVGVTFIIWWHLINSFEILTSPMLVHYHDHICLRLMFTINFMVITLSVYKLKCSFLDITFFFCIIMD